MDLNAIDSATVQPSPELDALIAEKWMGWTQSKSNEDCWCDVGIAPDFVHRHFYIHYGDGKPELNDDAILWSPSTNPAHAGEARRKADYWGVKRWYGSDGRERVRADIDKIECFCAFDETNSDKGKTEALATCRAIVEALKAADAAGGES